MVDLFLFSRIFLFQKISILSTEYPPNSPPLKEFLFGRDIITFQDQFDGHCFGNNRGMFNLFLFARKFLF